MRGFIFLFIFSLLAAKQIQINNQILEVEIRDTPSGWAKGLMGRKELPDGKGMLFIYPEARILSFWMKNTLIPLSIAFFDDHKTVINVLDMDVPQGNTLIRYQSHAPAAYALEVPQGWFEKHDIDRGAKFSFLD